MKKFNALAAISVLTLVIGLSTPRVYAEGPTETPGMTKASVSSSTDSEPSTADGPTETPGFFETLGYILSLVIS
jgi:hypothetical protein